MRRAGLALAWLLATIAVTALAWQAVSAADSQVSQQPLTPLITLEVARALPSSTSVGPITTRPPSDTSTSATSTTGPAGPPSDTPTTETASPPSTPASTTQPASTTTTVPYTEQTVVLTGGTVTFAHRPGEVVFVAAVPAPGFAAEVDDQGPDEVRVEFESPEHRSELRVRWDGGELDIEVREEAK
ncbi:MAG: hypothetical protein ACRDVM_07765 [Acidimicrobiia bacterium]